MKHQFVKSKPTEPSFSREGADGYGFTLQSKKVEVDYIKSHTGHGGKVVSSSITHLYYILEGSGEFLIDDIPCQVVAHQLIEIPPLHSFDYRGKMKMLLIMEPPFDKNKIEEIPKEK